jgi:NTE family protein
MSTAFVLSGGGSLGAVQVGMMQALAQRRIQPDVLLGASAGAVNAAFIASHGFSTESLASLAELWRRTRRKDVFRFSPIRHLLALAGARPSLCTMDGLKRLTREHLTCAVLEQARLPVHVVATEVLFGKDVLLSSGDAAAAVLPSTAIPGVFPPVAVDGRPLFDGGIANNMPIQPCSRPRRGSGGRPTNGLRLRTLVSAHGGGGKRRPRPDIARPAAPPSRRCSAPRSG